MQVYKEYVNTIHIPHTLSYLYKYVPSVLRTECFNDDKLMFEQEVQATEIGHLFEHILLDQLCLLKKQQTTNAVSLSGVTSWNWKKDPRGLFHIRICLSKEDQSLLPDALHKTIHLTEFLLHPRQNHTLSYFSGFEEWKKDSTRNFAFSRRV